MPSQNKIVVIESYDLEFQPRNFLIV